VTAGDITGFGCRVCGERYPQLTQLLEHLDKHERKVLLLVTALYRPREAALAENNN